MSRASGSDPMNLNKGLVLFTLFLVIGPVYANPLFKVEIAINESSVKSDFHRKTGQFMVNTTVTNISQNPQIITEWTQAGWSWVSDNSAVTPGIEALKNAPYRITLKPGEAHKSGAEMWADMKAKRPITFRLKYVPNVNSPASTSVGWKKDAVWSNRVTLSEL